jgi:hypothetical protein
MTTKGIASNTNRVEGPARPRLLALNVRRPNRGRFGGQIGVSGELPTLPRAAEAAPTGSAAQPDPTRACQDPGPGQHKLSTAFGYDVDPVNTTTS